MTRDNGDSAWDTLGAYAQVVRRRAWVVALFVILVPLTAIIVSRLQDPVYEASAKVLVSQQNLAATLANVPNTQPNSDPVRFLQTQARLARTTEVARAAIATAKSSNMNTDQFLGSSAVVAETDSDLLVFSARSRVPAAAAILANAYARSYTRYRNALDTAPLQRALITIAGRLDALRQAGKTNSALGASLLDKQQQLQTIEALKTDSATLVEPASAATTAKIKPQTSKNAQLALVFGLFVGLGLAFLVEALDRRLRSPRDIAERLQLPILGRIPQLSKRDGLPALTQPSGPHADAYRMLQMNLEFATVDRKVRTVMVTSAMEGEGKSTTAANLAITLARAGRSVVLVDSDFLRPSQADLFSVRASPGLIQVARHDAELGRALARIRLPDSTAEGTRPVPPAGRLAVMPAPNREQASIDRRTKRPETRGLLRLLATEEAPLGSTEVMVGGELRRILDQLRTEADLVIIDAPPLGTSITLWLSSLVDGVLVIANARVLRERMLDELVDSLSGLPSAKLGLVLTAMDPHDHSGYAYRKPVHQHANTEDGSAAASDRGS
jgi:succinoglycan biosynthesis transport protein ExoP